MMNKGSNWNKWNFHVHTKGTNKNDQFSSESMDEFLHTFYKKAFEEQVSAIGITDYYSIDRYQEAVLYRQQIATKCNKEGIKLFSENEITFIQNIFLFPNVELRLLPVTDKGRLVNIHCLFNPDYVSELENDFFSHLENQDHFKMNRHGIMSYGKSLDSTLSDEKLLYKKGLDNFVIDLKSLKDLISKNKTFKDNSLLVVSNSNSDGASAMQQHYDLFENEAGSLDGLRKSIYFISDAIFSANPKDSKYFVGKKLEDKGNFDEETHRKGVEEIIRERGSLKPCLVGCDAHKESDLFCKFTWVKADLTFEGLRQICFEPEQRVKIQREKPDFKEDKFLIEKIRFISPNKVFPDTPIYLNPNLNVIIGGKSSGKSILLFAIAQTLSADETVLKNEDGLYKYDLRKIDDQFDFQITTQGGFSQNLFRNENENSILPEIKYIPQNYLVKLAEPELNKKGRSLNKLVRDLIIEDDASKEIYQEFVNKLINNDKVRNSQIDTLFDTIKEVEGLEGELKSKSNKDVLAKNIASNLLKAEELSKSIGLTEEQNEEFKILQGKLEENKSSIEKFKNDFAAIQNFNTEFVQIVKNLSTKKNELLKVLQVKNIIDFSVEKYSVVDDLQELLNQLEPHFEIETNTEGKRFFKNETSKFKEILNALSAEQKKLTEKMQPFLKDEQTKKALETVNLSIANDRKAILDIENLSKKISDKKLLIANYKEELFKLYADSYQKYIDTIAALKERTIELEKDGLKIIGKAQFNFPKLRNDLLAISDGRTASYNNYDVLESSKKATDVAEFDLILAEVKILFDDLINRQYSLTNKTSISNAIKILLADYFFDYWEITYKNDRLGEMSTGKASFVILMLIIGMSKSKAPILIDQPEDNLDNRSITTDLVNYLKNKKLERQIIVVTHNANIVVNADAENVIVANQKGQNDDGSSSEFRFDYINGSIENAFDKLQDETDILKSMGIRQHIADIVEGGKDAFIKREKKYRFH